MGNKGLRRIQLGREVTEGTSVAATALWRGLGVLEDRREVVWVDEDVGYVSGLDRTYTPKHLSALAMESVPATFEQLPYIPSASIENIVTGAADGVGSGKIYQYDFNTTSVQAIQPYTLEGGDDQEAEEMEGSFVESFELGGAGGEAVMMSALWMGRRVVLAAFTAQPATPTVEDILFGNTKLYIDAIGGTIGTTQIVGSFLSWSLRVNSGFKFKYSGDGNLFPSIRYLDKAAYLVEFDALFEHDASGVARKVDWRAETARLVRVQNEGSTLATPGTLYSKKTMRFDCAAKVSVVGALSEQEGNDTLLVTFRSRYNVTAARHAQLTVVNEVASLP